ncbi:MAG: PQQ-binding-like beta-propeller repeat protein [Pseudonocardiaceae bacterium]|nr:PQQ-binding-like beta-propeller repeat protein [Pseudonocardiaceae bacterium]
MPAPERRSRGDVAAAALIAAIVLMAGTALWWGSDARSTSSRTAAAPGPETSLPEPTSPPASLRQVWRAPSAATPVPVVADGTVVTGDGGEVAGRDPWTGAVRWSYRRDVPLCTVGAGTGDVLAVHRDGGYCADVTGLDAADGARGAQRTGPLRPPTRLLSEGNLVAATGQRYLEVWRNDLVRTLQYGALPTPVKPGAQPRTGCSFGSVVVAPGLLGVIERCPGQRSDRLTVQQADPSDEDRPEVDFSTLLPGRGATLVAQSRDRSAVAMPDPARLVVLDGSGRVVAEHPLDVPAEDVRGEPTEHLLAGSSISTGGVVPTTSGAGVIYWFTGSSTVALGGPELRPLWSIPQTLGPGTLRAGRLLVPVPDGLAVVDTATGQQERLLPVDRGGYTGPVATASAGAILLEQRGATLVALR